MNFHLLRNSDSAYSYSTDRVTTPTLTPATVFDERSLLPHGSTRTLLLAASVYQSFQSARMEALSNGEDAFWGSQTAGRCVGCSLSNNRTEASKVIDLLPRSYAVNPKATDLCYSITILVTE
jgi:hypothetical protein